MPNTSLNPTSNINWKARLTKFLFPDPAKWQFWVLSAFIFKGATFIFLLFRQGNGNDMAGFYGIITGDTFSYIDNINNWLHKGAYAPDYRMPGYGIFYLPFAIFFGKAVCYNLLILLQYIGAALSVYPLALIAKYVFKSNNLFYLTFYLYSISIFSNVFDDAIQTESFTTSFLIISVFYFIRGLTVEKGRARKILFSGLLLTETIFLRPVFAPFIIVFAICLSFKKQSMQVISVQILILLLPFFLFDGLWIIRNYKDYRKIIPLTKYNYYPEWENHPLHPLVVLVDSWGGNGSQWREPTADVSWFGVMGCPPELHDSNCKIPNYIYTSKFNYDSLLLLKRLVTAFDFDKTLYADSNRRKAVAQLIKDKCLVYAYSIKVEKPFLYYVLAPIKNIKPFLFRSGKQFLYHVPANKLNKVSLCIKIFYSLIYCFTLIFGLMGLLLLSVKSMKNILIVPIVAIVGYTIIIHPVILSLCDSRYLIPAYPFLIVLAVYAFARIWDLLLSMTGHSKCLLFSNT